MASYKMTSYTGSYLDDMPGASETLSEITINTHEEHDTSGVRGRDEAVTHTYVVQSTASTTIHAGHARLAVLKMLNDTASTSTYEPCEVTVRATGPGMAQVTVTMRSKRALGYYWAGSMRASTSTLSTFRDASGSLILSHYGEQPPRLHEVQRVRGQVEIVLRRLVTPSEAASLVGLVGTVNHAFVDLSEAFGAAANTVTAGPRWLLVSGFRADPVRPNSSLLMGELSLLGAGINEVFPAGVGPWDTMVIWADENGVTPPDAVPYAYPLQPAVDWYTVSALYTKVSSS